MKRLLVIFLVLLIVIAVGLLVQKDSGYFLIRYGHWTLESSLWMALLCLLIIWLLLTFLWQLGAAILGSPQRLRLWGKRRRGTKVAQGLEQGFIDFLQGCWSDAEKSLNKVGTDTVTPFIAYIVAAQAANQQAAYIHRDEYLWKAQQSNKAGVFATQLQQADMQMTSKDWTGAVTTLKRIQPEHSNNPQLLKLWQRLYCHEHDWLSLCQLLPKLRKFLALPEEKLEEVQLLAFRKLLEQQNSVPSEDKQTSSLTNTTQVDWVTIKQLWQQIPRELQIKLRYPFIVALIKNEKEEQAIAMIEQFIKTHWDPQLVMEYGKLGGEKDLSRQLRQAEIWYGQFPDCPELLLCLARLNWRGQLWGKVQHYLKKLLLIKPCPEANYLMARVQEALGNMEAALNYYREGFKFIPALPGA